MSPKRHLSRRKVLSLMGVFVGTAGCTEISTSFGGSNSSDTNAVSGANSGDGNCQTNRLSGFSTDKVSIENAGVLNGNGFVQLSFGGGPQPTAAIIRRNNTEITRQTVNENEIRLSWELTTPTKETEYTVILNDTGEVYDKLQLSIVCETAPGSDGKQGTS